MTIKRITVSVPVDVARKIKKAAGKSSVSAWVTEAALDKLEHAELEEAWRRFYADVAPTKDEVRRAEEIMRRAAGRQRRRGAA